MSAAVKLPHLNANEDQATLTRWVLAAGARVRPGEVVCVVETTKTALDVEAGGEGYLHPIAREGERLSTGQVIAVLLDNPGDDPAKAMPPPAQAAPAEARRWTRKAEMVAQRLGVDLEALAAGAPGKVVSEADVVAASRSEADVADLVDDRFPAGRRERVLLIGGAGGGGAIALDCIARTLHQRAVAILDNNAATHGKRVLGVPILGATALAGEMWKRREFDAAIVIVTSSVEERCRVFESLAEQGIALTNVIDPSVTVRANVSLGKGNLIMPECFLSTSVRIGDNNFLAAGTMIEHHSVIGDHCTFGPRCALSGAVTVGSRVKFGMGVLVEPYLSIGDDALIPSGVTLTQSVAPRSAVKVHRNHAIRERD